jgi:hypothetical protein
MDKVQNKENRNIISLPMTLGEELLVARLINFNSVSINCPTYNLMASEL